MVDLHTHILPGMDDGAADAASALSMLQRQKQQGVDKVALSPHFYRSRESVSAFLKRRSAAWTELQPYLNGNTELPQVLLGAEVAWVPGMADWPELEELCYDGTRVLLVELPFSPWNDELFRQLYSLSGRRAVTPMIAHLERYFSCQKRQKIEQLLELGFPIQVSSDAVLHLHHRPRVLRLLENQEALLISDCHNLDSRPPNMGDAMELLKRKLGQYMASRIASATDEALLD